MTGKLQTFVDLPFGDGIYRFWLKLPQLKELETLCGCGTGRVLGKILQGRPLLDNEAGMIPFGDPLMAEFDVRHLVETVRLALIGGNWCLVNGEEGPVNPVRATQLMDTYVHGQPLADAWALAAAIACAMYFGVPVNEAPAGAAPAKPKRQRAKK